MSFPELSKLSLSGNCLVHGGMSEEIQPRAAGDAAGPSLDVQSEAAMSGPRLSNLKLFGSIWVWTIRLDAVGRRVWSELGCPS